MALSCLLNTSAGYELYMPVVTNWHDTNAMLGLGYMFCIVNWEAMRSFDHGETSKFITTGCSQNSAGLNCYI